MTDLNLRDLQTLTDLQTALGRFAVGAQESLHAAESEIRRTQEWLQERASHWQRQVEQARRAVARAEADLRRCEAGGHYDRDGRYYPPDCRAEMQSLARAQAHLRECEDNLRTAQAWRSRVEQAVNEYQREARRLDEVAGGHTEKARSFLGRAKEKYEAVERAATMVGLAGAMAAVGFVGAVAAGLKALNLTIGRTTSLRGEAGEELALRTIAGDLALKPVPFDRRQRGFDGILQGPNGRLMVMESKVSDDGKLHLAPDSYGHKQASAGWVGEVARRMTDPSSELYSEVNARIGQQMLDTGLENVPVLAAVTNLRTGTVDIYLRRDAAANDWVPLSEQTPLNAE